MIDDRGLLERAMQRFEPEPGLAERVMRRQERKRRNQRIWAGVLSVAISLAVAWEAGRLLLTEPQPFDNPAPTPSIERVGFTGLPPAGAEPTPVKGELLYDLETSARDGDATDRKELDIHVSVYTDGRLIWERHGAPTGVPQGATDSETGYLTQVLSPEGVEILRSEVLGTGLFERDLALRGDYVGPFQGGAGTFHGPSGLWLDFFGDRGKVTLSWYPGSGFDGPPSPSERGKLGQLVDRLADPAAWLPNTAWEDPEIRAFVASTYTVYICCHSQDPSAMPPPAGQFLDSGEQSQCIATAEARAIVEGFETAGLHVADRGWFGGGVTYHLLAGAVSFTPRESPRC